MTAESFARARSPNRGAPEFDGLTVRTRNCLLAENLYTLSDVHKFIADKGGLSSIPNCGSKTIEEIATVLGIDGLEHEFMPPKRAPDDAHAKRCIDYLVRHGYKVTPPG